MKLAISGISKEDWNEYCLPKNKKTRFDYSHLHGLNYCANPINGHPEERHENIGPRKNCHNPERLLKFTDDFCNTHNDAPCYLKGARMRRNTHEIANEMIELAKQGRPAIEAYGLYPSG